MNTYSDVKEIVTVHRPWGYFTVLEEQNSYKVKELVIKPHQRLSLQYHNHRSEQWIVAKGDVYLTCAERIGLYSAGDSISIPQGAIHRIENQSDSDVVIIEVQNGEYLGEDDIVRLEDDYSR